MKNIYKLFLEDDDYEKIVTTLEFLSHEGIIKQEDKEMSSIFSKLINHKNNGFRQKSRTC